MYFAAANRTCADALGCPSRHDSKREVPYHRMQLLANFSFAHTTDRGRGRGRGGWEWVNLRPVQ